MRTMELGTTGLQVPVVAVGCMRLTGLGEAAAESFVRAALEMGLNFFDHADVYGGGRCEEIFAKAVGMNAAVRETLLLQSKCGIVAGKRYDFSREHILSSVDGILRRLGTEYLDVLLLHRPDALMEPDEVAEAFSELHGSGKVRHFGVSNMNTMQLELLRHALPMPIVANQLQLSVAECQMIRAGINVNTQNEGAVDRDGGVLDYCRLSRITIQPWSPFQHGFFRGTFLGNPDYPELNRALERVAGEHGVTPTAVSIAWLLRHPARFQPVVGTMNASRLPECARASGVTLTRQQWYDIYLAAGNKLP